MLNEEQCWAAVQRRDASQDGQFWYAVVTTGVYCRPSCATPRQALRRNLRFFASAKAAEQAGYRACKRCGRVAGLAQRIDALCRDIEAQPDAPHSLAELGQRAHVSPQHLQRSFKARVGVTPRQYVEACRLQRLRQGLRESDTVTRAVQDAGLGSASRVNAGAGSHLGMTPGQYRDGGAGLIISYAGGDSPLGAMLLGATDRGLCFVQFDDDESVLLQRLRAEFPRATLQAMNAGMQPAFAAWMEALVAHLDGGAAPPDLPLDVRGTAFQVRVWRYLQGIPAGALQSYAEVAAGIGQPRAARAVASACARNRVAVLIPCHRVIRGDGGLGGYRWGLARKRALLDRERRSKSPA